MPPLRPQDDVAAATPAQRVARTDSQAARGSGAVVLLLWAAGFVGVDLDPGGPGTDLPVEVAVVLAGLLTAAAARWMNRAGRPPSDDLDRGAVRVPLPPDPTEEPT